MDIAVYPGSFNPLHTGHLAIMKCLTERMGFDLVYLVVSPQNPFKQASPDLLDENARLALARLAVRQHPRLKVSDFEFHLPRPSYTVDTLSALRRNFPDRQFTLIVGADNWQAFGRWRRADEILAHHAVLVYPRTGYPVDRTSLPTGVKLADAPLFPVSSTEIRRAIAQGRDASFGLDDAVWAEIRARGYYKP